MPYELLACDVTLVTCDSW